MAREPAIPHKTIVDFILSGRTTREAKTHFGFASDNIANLRIHAAFKRLGMKRPHYEEARTCSFCQQSFIARDYKQRTCGRKECQTALILQWQLDNPKKITVALAKYRKTSKGRANNLRMHATRRQRGQSGTAVERWNYAVAEARKRLRKLKELHTRNPWEYRMQHIQKLSGLIREFSPRRPRAVSDNSPESWQHAFRAIQTIISQGASRARSSAWELAVSRIATALKSGHKVRTWNRTSK